MPVVPVGPSSLLKGPCPSALPLQIGAAERPAEPRTRSVGEQMPGAHQVQRWVRSLEFAGVQDSDQVSVLDEEIRRGEVAVAHRLGIVLWQRRYLRQASTFLAPRSIEVADNSLRQLCRFLLANTDITAIAVIGRDDIEDFKVWLAAQPANRNTTLSANTQRQRIGMLRVFFERIIEWEWPDAPVRNPVIGRDLPARPDPLPKFLDDRQAAKVMAAARASNDPRDRLVVELLARTGMRAGEVCDLAADAVVLIGTGHWLRVPVGKLRNDRYVPLHPDLITLLAGWTADNIDHIRAHLDGGSQQCGCSSGRGGKLPLPSWPDPQSSKRR
jgi:integrase